MTVAQEEIFGPVVVLIPYDDEEDAIRIANDSDYGLAGCVFTSDVEHGFEVARRDPHRHVLGEHVRRRLQLAVRWLQAVGHRPRARRRRLRGLPDDEDHLDRPVGPTAGLRGRAGRLHLLRRPSSPYSGRPTGRPLGEDSTLALGVIWRRDDELDLLLQNDLGDPLEYRSQARVS